MISIPVPDRKKEPDMNKLLDKYGNSILRMCFLYLKDTHLAEDAVQDTFIKVYKSYSHFEGNSSEITWIMRIAINVCKNYLRNSWWKCIDESAILESIPSNESLVEDDSVLLEVMSLDRKYKDVILLFYYQNMKIREIAEVLQMPEATVSVRLKRAREKLKLSLEGRCFDE